MDSDVARNIAHYSHVDQRDRHGEPIVEHVERVAAAVPEDARAVAFLHDVLERTAISQDELREQGLGEVELAALELLTRPPDELYELYCLRIAWARGEAGVLARTVKLADLDDHISRRPQADDVPPYAWARRHITIAQGRSRDRKQAA
jgi:hypothetical protein